MSDDLVDEIEYMIDLLTKSGFFSADEILEILEDQFIDEEIDFSKFNISLNDFSNENFIKLENAFNEDGLDIFVAIEAGNIEEHDSVQKFRDTYYIFQKNFDIYPKIAFESYTKLKNYRYKENTDFSIAYIGEDRVFAGFTERGNVTRIQMFLGDD